MIRRLAYRIVLFAMPVLLASAFFESALRRIPNNYAYLDDRLLNHGDSIEVLVLGNSHAFNGVNPDGLGLHGFNAANISQDHRFDHLLLERYISHLPRLKAVVIPVSYASVGAQIEYGNEPWRMKNYALYMGMSGETEELADRFEVMTRNKGELVQSLWKYWRTGESNLRCGPHGGKAGKSERDLDFETEARKAATRHSKGPLGPYSSNRAHLEAIIRIAEERGIKVLLFSPPGHSTYRQLLHPLQLGLSRLIPRELESNHSCVQFIDLLSDPEFQTEDFSNPDHLNESGNGKLTRILALELQSQLTSSSGH